MQIVLSWYEILAAANVGVMRRAQDIEEKKGDGNYGKIEGFWQSHVEGALAEMAVAKHLDLYWSHSCGTRRGADVGPLQVRHTELPNGNMILHPGDKDDELCVFVTGTSGKYTLHGWTRQGDVKLPEYWRTNVRYPAYFVPREALKPIETLKENMP